MIPLDPRLICAFSKRPQNMSLVYGDTRRALDNRRDFLGGLGIDYRDLVCAKQAHKSFIAYARETDRGKGALSYDSAIADTDAFITDKKNLPLAVFTADCLTVFLYDPKAPSIGLVHAGWRSSQDQLTAKTVKLMREKFNSLPQNLYAGFGPAIRDCCYEVGEEFKDFFTQGLKYRDQRYYLDLAGLNLQQLLDSGLSPENISDTGICTSCQNEEFFSFRREGSSCGRSMSVMMLK